jgi:hypothetical protein
MKRWIYKSDILDLIKENKFNSEKEFEEYITPRLIKLFEIKPNQIENQSITTSFDYTLSNCADIVIRTDDKFKKVMLVIELKLNSSIEKFKNGDYEETIKQLHKYCQDTRSPYGILLTDENCFIYKNKYIKHNDKPKRESKNRIPNIKRIEDKMALNAFVDFIVCKKSLKYTYLFLGISWFFGVITLYVLKFIWSLIF